MDWGFPVIEYRYSDAGTLTCAEYPGSLGYETIDAATWASWDIDCEFSVSWRFYALITYSNPNRSEIR